MADKSHSLVEAVIVEGLDDWVYEVAVLSLVQEITSLGPSDRRTAAIGAIAEVLARGWMEAGSVVNGGFTAWNMPRAEAIERITTRWLNDWDEVPLTPGALVWLNNTVEGDRVARAAFDDDPEWFRGTP